VQPETVKKLFGADNPEISVIIPTMRTEDQLQALIYGIRLQTVTSLEVIIAYRFSPSGRARNTGAAQASGRYLIFMDDDIGLGDENVIANLCRTLESDDNIGLVGASTMIPPDANRFQKRIASEVPRMVYPVVDHIIDSDMVTTQCWGQRMENYEKIGAFTETIERGVDPEYRYRVRSAGYRVVIAPNTWTYHPPPINLQTFMKQTYRNGRASARAQRHHPELVVPVPDSGENHNSRDIGFMGRLFRSVLRIGEGLVRFRFLQVCERLIYGLGYIAGRLYK